MTLTNYERVKRWRAKNKDRVNAQAARRRAKHPEKYRVAGLKHRHRHLERVRKEDAERQMARRKKDPEGQRRRVAAFKARKEAEREAIAGRPRPSVCELCNEFHIRIVFDHCHQTGRFRGWLCDRCNRVLGLVYDNPQTLRKLASYLDVKTNDQREECASSEVFCWTGPLLSN